MCTASQRAPEVDGERSAAGLSGCPPAGRLRLLDAVLLPVAVYAFAGWVYIASNAVVHPATLSQPLTHLSRWPREDTFGVACFAVSFVAALGWRLLRAVR